MTDDRSLPYDHEPLNRAERRAQRYRPKAGRADPHAVGATAVTAADEGADAAGTSTADREAGAVIVPGSGAVTRPTTDGTGGPAEPDD